MYEWQVVADGGSGARVEGIKYTNRNGQMIATTAPKKKKQKKKKAIPSGSSGSGSAIAENLNKQSNVFRLELSFWPNWLPFACRWLRGGGAWMANGPWKRAWLRWFDGISPEFAVGMSKHFYEQVAY